MTRRMLSRFALTCCSKTYSSFGRPVARGLPASGALSCTWYSTDASTSQPDLNDGARTITVDRTNLPGFSRNSQFNTSQPSISTSTSEMIAYLQNSIRYRDGPMSVAEFMKEVLTHPTLGYYMKKDVFGAKGDFTTSPEISQLFGEMVGIWTLCIWHQLGCPARLNVVEVGPGRGTLMADLLRSTRSFEPFRAALSVSLLEVSPALRKIQYEKLHCIPDPNDGPSHTHDSTPSPSPPSPPRYENGIPILDTQRLVGGDLDIPRNVYGASVEMKEYAAAAEAQEGEHVLQSGVSQLSDVPVKWCRNLSEVPQVPMVIIAHELFDALPVHQFQKTDRGWCERLLYTTATDPTNPSPSSDATSADSQSTSSPNEAPSECLQFVLSAAPTLASKMMVDRRLKDVPEADQADLEVVEVCPQAQALAQDMAQLVSDQSGAALFVDYGHDVPVGHTLQAIRDHKFVDLLDDPGSADLSTYVDFGALRQAVEAVLSESVDVHGTVSQSHFLHSLGIQARLEQLVEMASDDQAEGLVSGYNMIVNDDGASGMGQKFRVMAVTSKGLGPIVGFESPSSETE